MITLFSAPKSFADDQIARIQRNAINSWQALGDEIEILLMGEEPGLAQAAKELDVPLLSINTRAPSGAPIISELFRLATNEARFSILGYINSDIVLLDDFLPAVKSAASELAQFLMVGNRWDIEINEDLECTGDWIDSIHHHLVERGRQHPPMGSDYFIFRKGQFQNLPDFALGRAGWDNWMIYKARYEGIPVVDASEVVTAVHQDHDYAHLPGGQPHYRHPESLQNIKLAGGYETMFRLSDANWTMSSKGVQKKRLNEREWPRSIEAGLIARFGAGALARLTRMLFHPKEALAYFRQKLFRADQSSTDASVEREVSS